MEKMEKMKRKIISIDEDRCNGCGLCVRGCHEGALQLIDGKARIVSELYCDGLGACIGECPEGAISVVEREAEAYDEEAVLDRILPKGEKTVLAHLRHLKEHGQVAYVAQALDYLHRKGVPFDPARLEPDRRESLPKGMDAAVSVRSGCPGTLARSFHVPAQAPDPIRSGEDRSHEAVSCLEHWPVQLHLLNPEAAYLKGADLLLAADCTAFSFGNFHERFLKGKKLAIACPKLDSQKEVYVEKLVRMIDEARIDTLTVVIMEVPCCAGLVRLAQEAIGQARRKIPLKRIVLGIRGDVLGEEWL